MAPWGFTQLALVFWAFQVAGIFLLLVTNTWVNDTPSLLVVLNPLYKAYGQAHMLLPSTAFATFAKAQLWRTGGNLAVWALIQWVGGAAILDFLRQQARK